MQLYELSLPGMSLNSITAFRRKPQPPTTMITEMTKRLAGFAMVSLLALPQLAVAQDAEEDENVFELSPFEVQTSGDMGYISENTLAGTRLNSSLKDTAAAISVYNEEFLNDLAATDMLEVMRYSINYDDDFEESGATATGSNQMLEFSHNFKVRGLKASRARNFFAWDFRIDSYNVERLDESRGPNSVLFGLGAPGGIVNTTTKQAKLYDDFGRLEFQIGDDALLRGSIDVNRVLIKDKLAIRFNAMDSDEEGSRLHEYIDKWGIALASTYKPAEWITIKLEYEKGDTTDNRARNETGRDEYSTWMNAGMPVRDTSGLTNPNANPDKKTLQNLRDGSLGISWDGSGNRTYVMPNGDIQIYRSYLRSDTGGSLSGTFSLAPGLSDPAMNLTGPYAIREAPFETYTGIIELNPADNLFMELAYNHLDATFFNMDPTGLSMNIYGNPNSHFLTLDGTETDEYAGMYYTESRWTRRGRIQEIDQFRFSGSYSFELGEKLGRHQLAVLYETYDEDHKRRQGRQYLESPVFHNDAVNRANEIHYRQYFNAGDYENMYAAPWDDDLTVTIDGVTYGTVWNPTGSTAAFNDQYKQKTYMGVIQSFWWNERIVTTFGYRTDERDLFEGGSVRNAQGFWEPSDDRELGTFTTYKPDTKTFGIVGHVTDWMSVLYNQSSSVTLANTNMRVLPDSLSPDPSDNDGKDVGFNFGFMDGKLNVRATYYTSKAEGQANYSAGSRAINRFNAIWDELALNRLDDNGEEIPGTALITQEEADAEEVNLGAHYFNSESEGYEFRVTANPTRNWTLIANFSITENEHNNIMPLIIPFMDQKIAEIAAIAPGDDGDDSVYSEADFSFADGTPIGGESGDSIYNDIFDPNELYDDVFFVKDFEGKEAYGNRKYRYNLFTRYQFRDGLLDGFYIGGGYRFQTGRVIFVMEDGQVDRGPDSELVDFLIGYKTKLWKGVDADFQINISNVFDDDTLHVARRNDAGAILRGYYETPRYIKFTTRLRF
jgi:outer membrane receptor protein involved in Fe transport